MKDTNCGETCPFVKQGFCASDKECPHYIETVWEDKVTSEVKFVKDCSPKRLLMQQNAHEARLEGVQRALEEFRNEYIQLSNYLKNLIEMAKAVVLPEQNKIEVENEKVASLEHLSSDEQLHL